MVSIYPHICKSQRDLPELLSYFALLFKAYAKRHHQIFPRQQAGHRDPFGAHCAVGNRRRSI
jgi:hypothetical protein